MKEEEDGRQSSGAVVIGRWAWALRIPYPILSPSLINRTVSMDVKHHERRRSRRRTTKLRSCVNREVGLGLITYPIHPPSLINHTVSVDVKHRERSSDPQNASTRPPPPQQQILRWWGARQSKTTYVAYSATCHFNSSGKQRRKDSVKRTIR